MARKKVTPEKIFKEDLHSNISNLLDGLNQLYQGLKGRLPRSLEETTSYLKGETKEKVTNILLGAEKVFLTLEALGYQSKIPPSDSKPERKKRKSKLEKQTEGGETTKPAKAESPQKSVYDPSTDYSTIVKMKVLRAHQEKGYKLDERQLGYKARMLMKKYLDNDPKVRETLEGGERKSGAGTANRTKVINVDALKKYIQQTIDAEDLVKPVGKYSKKN